MDGHCYENIKDYMKLIKKIQVHEIDKKIQLHVDVDEHVT